MQPFYDFKTALALRMSKRLGQLITASELTIVNIVPRATVLGTLTKELVVEVSYAGISYYYNYARIELYNMYDDVLATMVGKVPASADTSAEILDYASSRIKMDLSDYTVLDPNNRNLLTLAAKSDNPVVKGRVALFCENGLTLIPMHYWPLYNDGMNGSRGGIDLLNNFNWVDFGGKEWGAVPGRTNWVDTGNTVTMLDGTTVFMELIANDIGNAYGNIFSSRIETDIYYDAGGLFTSRDINSNKNKPWLYKFYGTNFVAPTSPFLDDTPSKLAITRAGNVYKIYQDGSYRGTYTTSTNAMFRYFGSLNRRGKQYIRNYTVYNTALTDAEVLATMAALK